MQGKTENQLTLPGMDHGGQARPGRPVGLDLDFTLSCGGVESRGRLEESLAGEATRPLPLTLTLSALYHRQAAG